MILWAGLNCCTSYLPALLSNSYLRMQGKESVLVAENTEDKQNLKGEIKMEYTYKELNEKQVVHYDFYTQKYHGNAAFLGGELVSVYLARHDGHYMEILESWSPREVSQGLYLSGWYSPDAVGRYARMYGKERVTFGDGWKYLALRRDKKYTT